MNETRKTYVKPAIEGTYLLPDEAVLGACKEAYVHNYCFEQVGEELLPTSSIGS
jgi:hypothetical protein